jgi:transcriptional regulator with GAF, ATPase, and Fis domain
MFENSDLLKIEDMKEFNTNNLDMLLHKILNYIRHIVKADAGTIYLKSNNSLEFYIFQNDSFSYETIFQLRAELKNIRYKIEDTDTTIAVQSLLSKKIITVDDVYKKNDYDFQSAKEFDKQFNYKSKSILTAPLTNFYTHEVCGVIQLINKLDEDDNKISFTQEDTEFVSVISYLITLSIMATKGSLEEIQRLSKQIQDNNI